MAKTIRPTIPGGEVSNPTVPAGTLVKFLGVVEEGSLALSAVFEVDHPGSRWDGHIIKSTDTALSVRVDEVGTYVRFDSHEEHLVYQQALTAHYLSNIAASLGNMEEYR